MFGKIIKKKVEKAEKDVTEVVGNANRLIDASREKIALLTGIVVVGIIFGIASDLMQIRVGSATIRMMKEGGSIRWTRAKK